MNVIRACRKASCTPLSRGECAGNYSLHGKTGPMQRLQMKQTTFNNPSLLYGILEVNISELYSVADWCRSRTISTLPSHAAEFGGWG